MPTQFDDKLKTYYLLDKQKKSIEKRLDTLNGQIKQVILGVGETIELSQTKHYVSESYEAQVQIKRSAPKIDEQHLLDLLQEKGLFESCTKVVPDHDLVKQAYIDGLITDSDLRSINQGSNITTALIVNKREGYVSNV